VVRHSIDGAIKQTLRQYHAAPTCPRCGGLVFAAETSEFVADGRIRSRWLCEHCDTDFRTVIKISG
jgi:ribosomal protein S27AE